MASREAPLTFGLVHGGAHGAWCWADLVREIEVRGHRAIAMDLPCEDDAAGVEAYAGAVVDAMARVPEPVVLVGHSLGGLTVPLVATVRPTRQLIFIAGLLPVPGLSFDEQRQREPDIMFPYVGGKEGLRERFFGACPRVVADEAMRRLRRQSRTPFAELTPLDAWPQVPSAYLVCTEDRAVNPAWSHRAVRERLGIEPVELVGSDHSPFLSRPAELAERLVEIAVAHALRNHP